MESHTFFGPGTKAILLIIYVYIIYFVNRRAIFIAQQYNNKDNNINASENGEASAKYCYRRIPPRTQNERLDIYIYIRTFSTGTRGMVEVFHNIILNRISWHGL